MKSNDRSRFIVCRAAAGSGKTYTLVRQFIELAFDAPAEQLAARFGRILAITFTNKAANEMKGRILEELDGMSVHGTGSGMGADLAQRLGMDDATLRRYAATVQQAILHNYSDLSVCTIDSFMHRLVRTFAHDLGLPLNFDVHIDDSDLIENAVDSLMALVGTEGQEELTEVLCEFAQHKMDEDQSYMIEGELAKLAEELFKEQTPEYLASLRDITPHQFREIHSQLTKDNRAYEQQMRDFGKQGMEIMAEHGIAPEDFYQSRSGAGVFMRKMAAGERPAPNSYVLDYMEGDKLGSAKCSSATRAALEAAKPRLSALFHTIENAREEGERLYNTRRLLLRHLYSLAVLNKMNELVAAYSRENDIVHISEFNKRIAEVVESEPMPFIYERIGTHYHNYLIDEFQDTSRMQWQNLVPLLAGGVSDGHTSLVVGDGKQAIYRFRKGDVEQFLALPHVENSFHGALLENPEVAVADRLDTNYRSCEAVVRFNNDFFEWAVRNRFADHAELQEIYIRPAEAGQTGQPDLAQHWKKPGGYVQLGFWELEKGPGRHAPLWEQMLADIRRQVDEKGYRYRDITLLARSKKTLNEISAYLTQQGVPVVSSESFLLTQSRTVMLLRSLFQYLVDGSDRVAAMRVAIYMRSLGLLRGDGWDTDLFLAAADGKPLPHLLERLLGSEGIALDCDRLRSLGLYDGCEEAIRMLGLQHTECAYTATLLNTMARYSTSHRQDWKEFAEWFDEQKDNLSTSTSDDLDAVRLMTIHKSKGLESPIIMYPVVSAASHPFNLWVHVDQQADLPLPVSLIQPPAKESTLFDDVRREEEMKQLMDDLNVLYVALTRPKEKLLIYCQAAAESDTTGYAALLRDYLRHKGEALGDDNRWHRGSDDSRAAADKSSQEHSVTLQTLSYPGWTDRIRIARQSAEAMGQFDEAAVRRGNQMHAILSLMRHAGECAEAVGRYRESHPGEEAEAAELETLLQQMMKQPEAARFFDQRHACKNECSLVWQGKVLRPDRIVLAGDETWVVDFKTGMPTLEHHSQVDDYCAAIRAMWYPNVSGYLLYIGADRCRVVAC